MASKDFEVPEFYVTDGSCLYTSQGDIFCQRSATVERFVVDETPNIPTNANNRANDNITTVTNTALENKYCIVSAKTNPTTGEVSYSFEKECTR